MPCIWLCRFVMLPCPVSPRCPALANLGWPVGRLMLVGTPPLLPRLPPACCVGAPCFSDPRPYLLRVPRVLSSASAQSIAALGEG